MLEGAGKFTCKMTDLTNAIKKHTDGKDVVISTNQDVDDSVNNLLRAISAEKILVGQSIGQGGTSDIYMNIKADGSEIIKDDDVMVKLTCSGGFRDPDNTCINEFNEQIKKLQKLIKPPTK